MSLGSDKESSTTQLPGRAASRANTSANHNAFDDRGETEPREECGVFGVWAPGEDVSKLTFYGLYALQHRGQEAAGIGVGNGSQILIFKDLGLVSQVFDEETLNSLNGHVAVGHTRYATSGTRRWENAQPKFEVAPNGNEVALGHNGNLVNYRTLRAEAVEKGIVQRGDKPGDADLMCALLASEIDDDTPLEEAAAKFFPRVHGAYCLTITDGDNLYAVRDPYGVRPLCIGKLDAGWVVSSETAALDIVGAEFVRYVEPGEIITINEDGVKSTAFAKPKPKGCVFEYVYLARPDSLLRGQPINATRVDIGRRLAEEAPADADMVIPVPESGTPSAVGYAQGSGIPFGQGLVKNSYVGRTFIEPTQTIRQLGIRLKLNPLRHVIEGKRLVVVDDSIVRGNTQRALVAMLRDAGAAEIHVRIASPPVKWPCFYGIDFPSPHELLANTVDQDDPVEAMRKEINADSLDFVSAEAMIASSRQPRETLCVACFDGHYPLGLPAGNPNAEEVEVLLDQQQNSSQPTNLNNGEKQ